jgi:hypothetical protein
VGKHYTPAHPTAMGRMKPETKAKDISIFSLVQQAPRLIVFPLVIYYFPTGTTAISIRSFVRPFIYSSFSSPIKQPTYRPANQQFQVISIATLSRHYNFRRCRRFFKS